MANTTLNNIIIDIKNDTAKEEDIKVLEDYIKLLISIEPDKMRYEVFNSKDFDIKKNLIDIENLIDDFQLIGRDSEGIIPVSFAKLSKCECSHCKKEFDTDSLYVVSSKYYPDQKVGIKLCEDCLDILSPDGFVDEYTDYLTALNFIKACRTLKKEYREHDTYKYIKRCMENNINIIDLEKDEVTKKKMLKKLFGYASIYLKMSFNYIYAEEHDELNEDILKVINAKTSSSYLFAAAYDQTFHKVLFIPQFSNLAYEELNYLGRFKIALNNIHGHYSDLYGDFDPYENPTLYDLIKDNWENNFPFKLTQPQTLAAYGVTSYIKENTEINKETNYRHPSKEYMYAFVETVLTNDAKVLNDIIPRFKFPQETTLVRFINFLKDTVDEIHNIVLEKNDQETEFGKAVILLYDKLNELNVFSADEYIKTNGPRKPRKLKDLGRHKKRNAHDCDVV